MPRPQFSLKSLLWLMAVVAAFFGGLAIGHQNTWQYRVIQALMKDNAALVEALENNDIEKPNLQFLPLAIEPSVQIDKMPY